MKLLIAAFLLSLACSVQAQRKTDLVVGDTTLVQRCVLKGAPSSRMIAVGMPGGFNYSFDSLNCAPASVWAGGFLDFKGETTARGGKGCRALGGQRALGIDKAPLRIGDAEKLPETLNSKGYRRDADTGAPTFLFEVDGVSVEQQIDSPSPGLVALSLRFPKESNQKKFYRIDPTGHVQLILGEGLRWSASGVIEIPAQQTTATITIHLKATGKKFVREVEQLSGKDIFRNLCSACHSIDGTKLIGPSFKGLWEHERTVTREGKTETVKADAAYIHESIVKPQAAIVQGYEAVPMADFSGVLNNKQIDALITYLKEIK